MGAKHPGRTKAQREALDQIGCGNACPPMARATAKALVRHGLIQRCEDKGLGRDRFGLIAIPQFQMPIPIHMQWCEFQAATCDEPAGG